MSMIRLTPAGKVWSGYALFILVVIITTMTACQPAMADQNVVCSQYLRTGMAISDPVAYTMRSSHPVVMKAVRQFLPLIPPEVHRVHGEAYGDAMIVFCSQYPNRGSWEASEYALEKANEQVFQTSF
jgi:hypothetical protein